MGQRSSLHDDKPPLQAQSMGLLKKEMLRRGMVLNLCRSVSQHRPSPVEAMAILGLVFASLLPTGQGSCFVALV